MKMHDGWTIVGAGDHPETMARALRASIQLSDGYLPGDHDFGSYTHATRNAYETLESGFAIVGDRMCRRDGEVEVPMHPEDIEVAAVAYGCQLLADTVVWDGKEVARVDKILRSIDHVRGNASGTTPDENGFQVGEVSTWCNGDRGMEEIDGAWYELGHEAEMPVLVMETGPGRSVTVLTLADSPELHTLDPERETLCFEGPALVDTTASHDELRAVVPTLVEQCTQYDPALVEPGDTPPPLVLRAVDTLLKHWA